jgi:hypothetical protein
MNGEYGWLCRLYLDGHPQAIQIIDTLIKAGNDLAFIRNHPTQVDYETMEIDYFDLRAEIDQAFDSLDSAFKALEIPTTLPVLGADK